MICAWPNSVWNQLKSSDYFADIFKCNFTFLFSNFYSQMILSFFLKLMVFVARDKSNGMVSLYIILLSEVMYSKPQNAPFFYSLFK